MAEIDTDAVIGQVEVLRGVANDGPSGPLRGSKGELAPAGASAALTSAYAAATEIADGLQASWAGAASDANTAGIQAQQAVAAYLGVDAAVAAGFGAQSQPSRIRLSQSYNF